MGPKPGALASVWKARSEIDSRPELVDPTSWSHSQEPLLVDESPDPKSVARPSLWTHLYLVSSFSPKLFRVLLPLCNVYICICYVYIYVM